VARSRRPHPRSGSHARSPRPLRRGGRRRARPPRAEDGSLSGTRGKPKMRSWKRKRGEASRNFGMSN
jgi:hypothetical protein